MKIPFSITANTCQGRAEIRILGVIGWETDSETFRAEVEKILAQGVTQAQVYINSPGGSVFDANEIVNILSGFKVKHCQGGALVASAAAYIACSCDTFEMPENGMLMIHRPSGALEGNIEDFESYVKLLGDMQESYRKLFASKAKDKAEFEKAWASSDWWLTAKEAQAKGFATSVKAKVKLDKDTTDMLQACGCPEKTFKTITQSKNTKMELLSFFKNLFGLSDTATEQDAINSVTRLQSENKTLKDEKAALQAKIDAAEKLRKDHQVAEAKMLLDAAVLDGRLTADTRKLYEPLFASDHDSAKAAIAALPKRNPIATRVGTQSSAGKYDLGWNVLDKAGMLHSLKTEDPELYKEKFKERFGVEPQL